MNSDKTLLEVRNVTKSFGGIKANDNVSLKLKRGEIRGLIGPNGSGKTTLINLVTGMYTVDNGSIWYSGKRIDGLNANKMASMGIMRTFQVARIFRDLTVLENMMIPGYTQGLSKKEAKKNAEELLDFALLSRLKDHPAKSLSGGQNMLLQIVRCFMHKQLKLYVMDEPFAGVHQLILNVIIDSIKMMNKKNGVTFLIVSHDMSTVGRMCEKVNVLCKGECIADGTLEEIAHNSEVIDGYLGG